MPFWSKRSRAERIVDTVPAYAARDIVEISLAEWRERWLTDLDRDGLLIGVNWTGRRAIGDDRKPVDALRNLDARASLGE
jgi:hypothetical protein